MNIIGQEHILNYLKKSIEKNRVSHAYLFEGLEGLGTKVVALWFAKYLECQSQKAIKPCGVCQSCKDIDKNRYPDLAIISIKDNKKEISIEQIRELKRHLSLSAYSGLYKIAIIKEADKMTSEAANALLKTLEEPQGNTVLILITSTPSLLPKTIVSRCEEIKFKTVSLDKMPKSFIEKEYTEILQKPLTDIFKYIEQISKKKKQIIPLLDSWLFSFRDSLMKKGESKYSQSNNAESTENFIKILKEIQKTKNLISNTNVNKRLALEVLAIELKVQSQKSLPACQ